MKDTVTIINPVRDGRGAITDWTSVVIDGVHLEQYDAVSTSGTARERADSTFLMIWQAYTESAGLSQADVTRMLKPGGYVVIGQCDELPQAGMPLKDFLSRTEAKQIVSCESCLYGNYRMRHWEVYAK